MTHSMSDSMPGVFFGIKSTIAFAPTPLRLRNAFSMKYSRTNLKKERLVDLDVCVCGSPHSRC